MSGQEILALVMLGSFFVLLMAGVPVAITLGTVGFVFGALGFGTGLFNLLPSRIYGVVANYQWLAIPLFVFMGVMLEKSRLADDLLDVVGHLAGAGFRIATSGAAERQGIVQRLDVGTSGVMVIAKSEHSLIKIAVFCGEREQCAARGHLDLGDIAGTPYAAFPCVRVSDVRCER